MTAHVDQVLGVAALAVTDRVRAGVAAAAGVGEGEAGALVHVQAWPGGSIGDLAGVVGLSQPAAVRLVDRLVEHGLVRREAGRDRRTVALVLTEAGARTADAVLAARAEVLGPLVDVLSEREREVLAGLLGRVAAGVPQDRASAVRACRLCDRVACYSGVGCPLEHNSHAAPPEPSRATTKGR